MAGVRSESNKCQLCLKSVVASYNSVQNEGSKPKLLSHLWNYLYHKNVRESVASAVTCASEGIPTLPRLTFTISVGEEGDVTDDHSCTICDDCCGELEKLDKLHQQLEGVRRSIEAQVRRMNDSRKLGESEENEGQKEVISNLPRLQMSMAGSVLGKENISQALKFLGGLCDGLSLTSTSKPAALPSTSRTEDHMVTNGANELPTPQPDRDITAQTAQHSNDFAQMDMDPVMKVEEGPEDVKIIFADHLQDLEEREETGYDFGQVRESTPPHTSSDGIPKNEDYLFLDESDNIPTNDPLSSPEPPLLRPTVTAPVAVIEHVNVLEGPSLNRRSPNRKKVNRALLPCGVCGKRINGTANLANHMRVHTGERPFECDFCKKRFVQQMHLDRHRRLHTGDRPFSCEVCNLTFSRKDAYKSHRIRAHSKSASQPTP